MLECCPTCKQPYPTRYNFYGRIQHNIYNWIAMHPEGVTTNELLDYVYRNRKRPSTGNVISVHIAFINRVLEGADAPVRVRSTRGPGARYQVVPKDKKPDGKAA